MPPNVLLIVIDTARADIVHEMMESGELPGLRSLAEEGTQFFNAISPSPWTLPAHASLFTGQRATDHGAHAGNKVFEPTVPTLAEHLRDAGYRRYGISGNIWISPEFGFDSGFDNLSMKYDRFWNGRDLSGVSEARTRRKKASKFLEIVSPRTALPTLANGFYSKVVAGRSDKGGANTARRTRTWIRRYGRERSPFFYFINFLEPHLEYDPPREYVERFLPPEVSYEAVLELPQEPWRYVAGDREYTEREFEGLRALYKGELKYTDEQIRTVTDELRAQGIRDRTTIIVVGDHGENIGDHQLMDHQYCLYQTLIHVPLIVSGPGFETEDRHEIVETRDVFPTILDIAGVEPPDSDTVSKRSLLDGDGRNVAISEYKAPQPSLESLRERLDGTVDANRELDRTLRAIQTNDWKLIEGSDASVELYDLSTDPTESVDRSEERPELVEELQRELDERGVTLSYQQSRKLEVSDASRDRLKKLGYI